MDVLPSRIPSWQALLNSSPHPLAPTIAEILADRFNPEECNALATAMRATIESGKAGCVDRTAYFAASKPTC